MSKAQLLLLTLVVVAPACRKHGRPAAAADEPDATVAVAPKAVDTVAEEDLEALRASFRLVHFDTDSAALGRAALDVLATSAAILRDHPSIVVDIEGHADERGTTDHNLALGEARASAVRKALVSMGVASARLRTTSFGEEHPAVDGHDEVAWAENRRAEFRVRVSDGAR